MDTILQRMRSGIPAFIKRPARVIHRRLVFWRALRRFMRRPELFATPGNSVLADLIYGWGNEGWSGLDEYLAACIQHALKSAGPILECGSGLSTVLIGLVAKSRGQRHYALEHSQAWATRVQRVLSRLQLDSVVVITQSPLKDYGDFSWYTPEFQSLASSFALVICDGPPSSTKGGRYGLIPVMRDRLQPGCVILLDDAERPDERSIAERWRTDLGASLELNGKCKPYLTLRLPAT